MNLLRNHWYAGLWSQHLADKPIGRRILNRPVVFFRGKDDAPSAMEDACPHRFVPLSSGRVTPEGFLRCGYHGLEFDGNGACVRNPHTNARIPPAAKVKTYPVVERHQMVWIWMGEAAPNPDTIPDLSMLDDADPTLLSDPAYIEMAANFTYIVENLLDLGHVGVLHDGLLGNAETLKADLNVHEDDKGDLIVSRAMMPIPVPEILDLLYRNDGQDVDHWSDIRPEQMIQQCVNEWRFRRADPELRKVAFVGAAGRQRELLNHVPQLRRGRTAQQSEALQATFAAARAGASHQPCFAD